MPISDDRYREILREHGRRVANRVAYASGAPANGMAAFYACYAPEHSLAESERAYTPLIVHFDPMEFFDFYPDTHWPNDKPWYEVASVRLYGPGPFKPMRSRPSPTPISE